MNALKISAFAIASLLVACGGPKENTEGTKTLSGEVKIDGSSTVYPITEAVAEEFRAVQPNVKVTVGLSGTGGGFKKFTRGEIDINDASRSIKQEESDAATASKIGYLELKVAYDGLTVVVNPENNFVNDMTVEELKMMWAPEAQGKITKWSQVRAGWPNEEFRLYGAGTESGTYDYFTEAVVGKSHSSRGDFTASEDDNVLVKGVSTDKNGLAFFGYAYYEENAAKLKAIGIDDGKAENGAGPIKPTLETVKNKSYAPLSRPLFIYVNSTAVQRPEVAEFIRFYLKNAGTLSADVGFIPMTEAEYKTEMDKFEAFMKEHTAK